MKVITPDVEFVTPMSEEAGKIMLRRVELIGRTCYKSENRITEDSAETFVQGLIKRGHESVLEHCSFTLRFICDRGISHEIVRHRLASYSQESTRYCNYSKDGFGNEITVVQPCFFWPGSKLYDRWAEICSDCEDAYLDLLEMGATPQQARTVLPHSLKTEVVMTANIREWRHFFRQRCSTAAHPQMIQIACMALEMCHQDMPVFFEDIYEEVFNDEERDFTGS